MIQFYMFVRVDADFNTPISGEDNALSDQPYRYLTVDEMKSLGDDSLPIDVTRDERIDSNKMVQSTDSNIMPPQAIEDSISPQHVSFQTRGREADNVQFRRHTQQQHG